METNNQDKNSTSQTTGSPNGDSIGNKPENAGVNNPAGTVSGKGIPEPTISKLDLGTGDISAKND